MAPAPMMATLENARVMLFVNEAEKRFKRKNAQRESL
jgi:hypothetical protein